MNSASGLISVIIPVFNTNEQVLTRCISSVLNQSYPCIEIIVIDDGSEDVYQKTYDSICSIDSRIKIVRQRNEGVSVARNHGTKVAKGEYICYVDSDDIVPFDAFEKMYHGMIENNVDCIIGLNRIVNSDLIGKECTYSKKEGFKLLKDNYNSLMRHYLGSSEFEYSVDYPELYIGRGPYARLIKAEIAQKCEFLKGLPIGEDMLWNLELLNKCDSTYVLFEHVYDYIIYSSNTAIRKYYGNREAIATNLIKELEQRFPEFCEKNADVLIREIMTEWSSLLRFEYCSEKCKLNLIHKLEIVRRLTHCSPWNKLFNIRNWKCLAIEDKLLLVSVKIMLWVPCIKLFKFVKGEK